VREAERRCWSAAAAAAVDEELEEEEEGESWVDL
jgi:hypothetical protein